MLRDFQERFDTSWIYHDSALEGVVYTMEELQAAIDEQVVSDSTLIPVYDEIRQHKAAVDLVRELAQKKTVLISTHILQEVTAIADRVLVIFRGRLVFDGTPRDAARHGSIEELFYALTNAPAGAVE